MFITRSFAYRKDDSELNKKNKQSAPLRRNLMIRNKKSLYIVLPNNNNISCVFCGSDKKSDVCY